MQKRSDLSLKERTMPKLARTVEVCDFCYAQHQQYMQYSDFKHAHKETITKCSCCGGAMCLSCYKHALGELQWSILAQYEFTLCRQCIVSYRRLTDMQEQMESMIHAEVQKVKEKMKEQIYSSSEKRWQPW